MAKTKIKTQSVLDATTSAKSAKNTTVNVGTSVNNIRWRTDGKILGRNGVSWSFTNIQNSISQIATDIGKICQYADSAVSQYQYTENQILREGRNMGLIENKSGSGSTSSVNRAAYEALFAGAKALKKGLTITKSQYDKLRDLDGSKDDVEKAVLSILGVEAEDKDTIFGSMSVSAFLLGIQSENHSLFIGKAGLESESGLEAGIDIDELLDALGKDKLDIEDKLKDKGWREEDEKNIYYDDGDENSKKDKELYETKATIAELKEEASAKVALVDETWKIGESGEVSAEVLSAEAHASIAAGFYVIGDDNVKRFSPGVNAEIGASVTALEVSWDQQWAGNEMLGFGTEVTATAGKAEAKADATIQIFNESGKLDAQFGLGASAEAIAGEIEGTASVNVLGGEVGVTGGVNFGIGAHADVGFRDGVLRCDVGASLGVGVSLDVEVDVGGMVDTVVDGAVAAWDTVSDGAAAAWDTVTGWFD